MEIQKAIDEFILCCEIDRHLSNNTIKAYRQDLKQLRLYLDEIRCLMVEDIDRFTIRKFLRSCSSQKARTIKRKFASIRSFFKFLVAEGILNSNPAKELEHSIKIPKVLPRSLPISAIRKVLKGIHSDLEKSKDNKRCDSRLRLELCVLELLYGTGIRVGELSSLNLCDVDLRNGSIRVRGKGDKERVVPIFHGGTIEALQSYLECRSQQSGPLLLNRNGTRLSDQSIRSIVRKRAPEATPHMFRHSLATQLLSNGTDLRFIQKLLGHSSIVTTTIYAHVEQTAQRRIIRAKHPRLSMTI